MGGIRVMIAVLLFQGFLAQGQNYEVDKIGGITIVAPPKPFSANPFDSIVAMNAGWVAIVPYAFTPSGTAELIHDSQRQWWGETPEGVEETIRLAHARGLKVMLKPHVWLHDGWIGELDFKTEAEWLKWESGYRTYLTTYADMARRNGIPILCIGTEVRNSVDNRPQFWRKLIKEIREIYQGQLTYCANWDDYEKIEFWRDLDYIGISAYFPLSERQTPQVDELQSLWNPVKKALRKFSRRQEKPVLFAEYGYLSVDGAAGKTWELEKIRWDLGVNEVAQANAIEALLSSFCDEAFWAGGFLWKWFPHDMQRADSQARDYTPEEKLSEDVVERYYLDFYK